MPEREPQAQKSVLQRLKDLPRRRLPIEKIAALVTNTSWDFKDVDFYNLMSGREFEFFIYNKHKGINLSEEEKSVIARAIVDKFESLKGDPHAAESRKKLLRRLLSFDQVEGIDNLEDYLINAVNSHQVGAEVLTLRFGPKILLKLRPHVLKANLARSDFTHDRDGLVDYDTELNRAVYSLKIDLLEAVGILKTDGKDSPLLTDESIVPFIPNIIDAIENLSFQSFRIGSENMRQRAPRIKDYFASFNSESTFESLVLAIDSKFLFKNTSDRKLIRSKFVGIGSWTQNVGQPYVPDRQGYPDLSPIYQDYEEYYFRRVDNTYEYNEYPDDNPIARGAIESLARIASKNPSLTVQYERALKHFRKKYEHSPRRRTTTIEEKTNISLFPGIQTRSYTLDF